MFDLSPHEAIAIQMKHIIWYADRYPTGLIGLAAHVVAVSDYAAFDILDDWNTPQNIFDINKAFPRGGQIESIISAAANGVCWLPENYFTKGKIEC